LVLGPAGELPVRQDGPRRTVPGHGAFLFEKPTATEVESDANSRRSAEPPRPTVPTKVWTTTDAGFWGGRVDGRRGDGDDGFW